MNRLSYRAHSWLADRIPSVQYPREVTTIGAGWRYSMPFGFRVLIGIAGAILFAGGAGVLLSIAVVAWSVLR